MCTARADRETAGRVGAAAGGLADELGAAQRLQGVAEVLAAGERPAAGQHVDRPVGVAGPRHVRQRPELPGLTGIGLEDVVEVGGLLAQQVAAPQHHALRRAAPVVPQVDDERVGPGHQLHGRADGRPRVGRHRDPAHVQVADVAVQPLHPPDAEVVQPPPLPHGQPPGLVVLRLAPLRPAPPGPDRTTARTRRRPGHRAGPGAAPSRSPRCLSPVMSCRCPVTSSVSVTSSSSSYSPAASLASTAAAARSATSGNT